MKITAIIENTQSAETNFQIEAGLALYLEVANKHILFDAGVSSKMLKNAKTLHIPLDAVDVCIVSHGHFDHTGGLIDFFHINKTAPIYMKPKTEGQFFFKMGSLKKNISVPSLVFSDYRERIKFIDTTTEILPGVTLITEIEQKRPLARGNLKLLQKTSSGYVQDSFDHELIAVIKEGQNTIALTGCSHNGILNMIDAVYKIMPQTVLSCVLGGFHLMGIPLLKNSMAITPDEVKILAQDLLSLKIPKIYTMHCTGKKAYGIMKQYMGDRLEYLSTGQTIDI